MLQRLRDFFNTKAGLTTGLIAALLALGLLAMQVKSSVGASDIAKRSTDRVAVCSQTGKSFDVTLKQGMTFPIESPYSGAKTGYLADTSCNWTADGKVGGKTTYILLNETIGKKGPTFCPDCHRLVVRDNPPAAAGRTPPPTDKEYAVKTPEK